MFLSTPAAFTFVSTEKEKMDELRLVGRKTRKDSMMKRGMQVISLNWKIDKRGAAICDSSITGSNWKSRGDTAGNNTTFCSK